MTYEQEVMLDQYRMLRMEIVSLIEENRKNEVQVIGALAIFYSWLASQSKDWTEIWMIGTALVLFGGFRCIGFFMRMGDIAKYMMKIEEEWRNGAGWRLLGWESYFDEKKKGWSFSRWKNNSFPQSYLSIILWVSLLVATFMAPAWLDRIRGNTSIPGAVRSSETIKSPVSPVSGKASNETK